MRFVISPPRCNSVTPLGRIGRLRSLTYQQDDFVQLFSLDSDRSPSTNTPERSSRWKTMLERIGIPPGHPIYMDLQPNTKLEEAVMVTLIQFPTQGT